MQNLIQDKTLKSEEKLTLIFLNHIPSEMRKENLLDGMINRPIMNGEKAVGVITDYNIETGFWNGVLWCDTYPSIMENYICSVELK